jgi:hypothetical protein
MIFRTLTRVLASLALSGFILSSGLVGNPVTFASSGPSGGQDRDWRQARRRDRDDRERARREERNEMSRIREMDREHQLRYRTNNRVRTVGYYDRWRNFHQYGYYDRFGFFHRY